MTAKPTANRSEPRRIAVSKITGMDQATLSRLENGRQPNPTVDTLWRYASAVGRQLVLTHADAAATAAGNGKAAKSKMRKSAVVR